LFAALCLGLLWFAMRRFYLQIYLPLFNAPHDYTATTNITAHHSCPGPFPAITHTAAYPISTPRNLPAFGFLLPRKTLAPYN
jgi:hypothetical protein